MSKGNKQRLESQREQSLKADAQSKFLQRYRTFWYLLWPFTPAQVGLIELMTVTESVSLCCSAPWWEDRGKASCFTGFYKTEVFYVSDYWGASAVTVGGCKSIIIQILPSVTFKFHFGGRNILFIRLFEATRCLFCSHRDGRHHRGGRTGWCWGQRGEVHPADAASCPGSSYLLLMR